MSGLQSVTAVTMASAVVTGMVLAALLGSIKLPLANRLRLGEAKVGGLLSALALALSPMLLLSGILIDQFGVQVVLLAGSVLTALSLVSLALCQRYTGALGALFLAGGGAACLNNVAIVLIPKAFFPDNPSASANLGNAFYGLGALATPTLVERLIRGLGFRQALGMLSGVSLIPALLAGLTQTAAFDVSGEPGDLWAVLPNPLLWLASLAGFLYVPLEGSLGTWATTYLILQRYARRK